MAGKIADRAQAWLLAVSGATTAFAGQLVLGAFVMTVSIFFFLLDGPNISRTLMRLIAAGRPLRTGVDPRV